MMVAERAIDEIAWSLGLYPAMCARRNLYREEPRRHAPRHGREDNIPVRADTAAAKARATIGAGGGW
jgi:xanthine dehydrogenase molybdopterin-binding subunit B